MVIAKWLQINVHIDIVTISDSVSVDCYLTLIVFDSYYQFVDFITQEMWLNNHSAVCISEKNRSRNLISQETRTITLVFTQIFQERLRLYL